MDFFAAEIRPDGVYERISLHGELDLASAPELVARVEDYAVGGRDLLFDLSGLTFFGCAGISALLQLRAWAQDAGGSLRVTATTPPIRKALELTGVDRILLLSNGSQKSGAD